MHWTVFLGIAIIGYAAVVLVLHLKKMSKGDCGTCPYAGNCDRHCEKNK